MNNYHVSVLLKESIDYLSITPGKSYIDATLGGGGHTEAILERGGRVLGIDVDQDALDYIKEEVKSQKLKIKNKENLVVAKGNFRNIDELARANGFEKVAGVLFDLGVSSHQFDTQERGFSFLHNAELDMRMDTELGVTAKDLLRVLPKQELAQLFFTYGEERFGNRIAEAIVERRESKSIDTTGELAQVIERSVPRTGDKIHPATRVFQALRIAVNDELGVIEEALPKALDLLEAKGRIAVISFHSLEDRIIKHTFQQWTENGLGTIITKKPIIPSEEEILKNSRSRSSKLRVFEKN